MTDDGFGGRYLRETIIDSIHVTDGMLTLGIKGNDGWYKADNFRLYYWATAPPPSLPYVRAQLPSKHTAERVASVCKVRKDKC